MIPATAIRAFLLFLGLMAAPIVDAEAVNFCDLVKAHPVTSNEPA